MIHLLSKHFNYEVPEASIEVYKPMKEAHGDYSTNGALKLAKGLEIDAMECARKIATSLEKEIKIFSKIEVVKPGFINFFLSDWAIYQSLNNTPYSICQFVGESFTGKVSMSLKVNLCQDEIQSIQYIHSRIFSIINYYKNEGISIPPVESIDSDAFEGGLEKQIVKRIYTYPSIIRDSIHKNEPKVFYNYLWELKENFYRYHEALLFRDLEGERLLAVLKVLEALRVVINHALGILGLDAPEKM